MYTLEETLIAHGIATENEIALVTSINGHTEETLESILYSRTGYRSLVQYNSINCYR